MVEPNECTREHETGQWQIHYLPNGAKVIEMLNGTGRYFIVYAVVIAVVWFLYSRLPS